MNTEKKVFYASQDLIPAVTESLALQLEENYKVKIENRLNETEITITKHEMLAWAGGKILKTISLSGAPNGQIICRVSGIGFGGILVPCIIMVISYALSICFPFFFLAVFITCVIIGGLKKKSKLTKEIFELVKEAIEANKNIAETQNVEKKCPNCGSVCQGVGFCAECGTKIN